MIPYFGRKVTKAYIELLELSALQKVLAGFRLERGLPPDPDAELKRLRLQLRKLEKILLDHGVDPKQM